MSESSVSDLNASVSARTVTPTTSACWTERTVAPPRTFASAFAAFQTAVNTHPDDLAEARRRRDLFDTAYCSLPDVIDVFCSGSLARRTHIDPIHDVDTVVIFDATHHPDWNAAGASAVAALIYTRDHAIDLLGRPGAKFGYELAKAEVRNHSVRCTFKTKLRDADFTVDVTPALRQADGTLRIPEKNSSDWITSDPEHLINVVHDRQEAWDLYVPCVRDVKYWRRGVDTKVKSLVMEIIALDSLRPAPTIQQALANFFAAAEIRVNSPIEDPAGHCGPIQPDLDVPVLRAALKQCAELARRAIEEERIGRIDDALRTWRKILGSKFPAPIGAPGVAGIAAVAPAVARPRRMPDHGQG
jgi:hypothetical protein